MDLQKLVNYDKWANKKVFQVIRKIDDSSLSKEIESLFAHLLTTQLVWVNRINKETLPEQIWPQLTLSDITLLVDENPDRLWNLIVRKDETVQYKNSKGDLFKNTVEDILLHLIIHGQHHRAQISTLLRKKGVEPPVTDFIFFLRTLEN